MLRHLIVFVSFIMICDGVVFICIVFLQYDSDLPHNFPVAQRCHNLCGDFCVVWRGGGKVKR